MSNLEEVKAPSADVIAIDHTGDEFIEKKMKDSFCINEKVNEIIAPLVYVVTLQLFPIM